jgi:hypothetical protein
VSGNATWSPKEGVATATYFVRAFVMRNSSATVQYQVALGNSQGYFQVHMPCCRSFSSCLHQHMVPDQAVSAPECHALVWFVSDKSCERPSYVHVARL